MRCFFSQYYYSLSFTLLTKSVLLVFFGMLFILLYCVVYKEWTSKKEYKKSVIALNLLLLLGYFIHSVVQKEDLLENGQIDFVEAPSDLRSLMQGDYMTLRYAMTRNFPDSIAIVWCGWMKMVWDKVRLQPKTSPLNTGGYLIEYTIFGN